MAAISRGKVKIYIQDAGVAPSTLVAGDIISGEIKSYSQSGGTKDVESDPVFGGFVGKKKPQEQLEISLELVPKTDSLTWEAMAYAADGTATGIYTTKAVDLTVKMIVIQSYDGTTYKSIAYNNCNVTAFDMEHNADDNQSANITFKLSPTDDAGIPNRQSGLVAATSLIDWASLETD